MTAGDVLPVPRSHLSRSVLRALADRPASMGAALRRLRSTYRYPRVTVGRFFWEVDRLIDAGYLASPSLSLTEPVSEPNGTPRSFWARARSGRLDISMQTPTFHLHIDLSMIATDSVTGGDES